MRKAMWKKGLSVAMAAAMLTGTVTVPAVFNNSAIVKAAGDEQQKGMPEAPKSINGMIYAIVNMEYADFFYGELNNTAVGTSTTLDLSKDLLADYRAEGMYDAVTSATSKKSTQYATSYYETGVKNDETETIGKDGKISNTNLYGIKEVRIAIPEALYNNLYAQKDGEYKNNKIYEYLNNATYSDTAFNTEYKVLNADGTFSKMITNEGTVEDKDALPVLATSTKYGDYEIDIENLGVDGIDATKDNMYGIILTDEKGNNYGLLHSDNAYKKTQEFAWAVNDVFSVHGNKVPYQRTNGLNEGNTVKKITYLLKDSADIVINTDIKLKKLIDTDKVNGSAEKATYNANGTEVKFNFNNLPSDDYSINTLVKKGADHGQTIESKYWSYDVKNHTLTLDGSCGAGDEYVATFKSAEYGDIKVTFAVNKADQSIELEKDSYTLTMGAASFDLGAKAKTALKYTSSDENVVTVDENGKVTLKGEGTAEITVKAEADDNYNETAKTVKIVVNKVAETKPATTTEVKQTTTTVAKPATKVTVKKQTAKVKAGKKKLTIRWKKDKAVSGYQIKLATKKNFKGAKTYTVKSYKTYKKVIKKLKSKKKYYVKVRAYKTVGKSKVYGAYSSVKSCKVK